VRELADATARLGVRVVLPGTEGSLRAVTGREQVFPDGTAVGACPPEVLQRATDKGLLTQLAREAGLEGPPGFALSAREDDFDNLPFPAVVKPMRTADDAGQRIRITEVEAVSNAAELRQLLAARPEDSEVLLQPQIDGTLAAICGVAWQGELVCAVHQRSPRIWPPNRGISSYAITTPPDRDREAGVAALVRSLGWSGIFGVQFLLSDGHAYVIDFNPRIYGSLALAIASGLNLPTIWTDLLLGRPPTPARYRSGVRYRAEEDDYRALARLFRRGERAEALLGFLPRPRTVYAVFALTDPGPLLVSLEKLGRMFATWRREAAR
jgi:carbamoylphosphate synthase large subunit